MAKDLGLVILFDFYGGLLTDRQAAALDYYYNQDFSLAETAEEMGISRQGVMAFLKQGEKHLREFEAKLGLARRFEEVSANVREMRSVTAKMRPCAERDRLSALIDSTENII